MSLRRRLALLSAAAVALTVVLASAIIYVLVRDSLRDQVDDDLRAQAEVGRPACRASTEALDAGLDPCRLALRGLGRPGRRAARRRRPRAPRWVATGGRPRWGRSSAPTGEVIPTPGTRCEIPVSDQAPRARGRAAASRGIRGRGRRRHPAAGADAAARRRRRAAARRPRCRTPRRPSRRSVVILFLVGAGGRRARRARWARSSRGRPWRPRARSPRRPRRSPRPAT